MKSRIMVPTAANKLMQDAITGRSSRRDIIKRGSALGLSTVLMDRILRASSVGAQASPEASPTADQPVGWSLEAPVWLDADLSGITLNVQLDADGPGAEFAQAQADLFAETTGAVVNYIKGPESTTDRLTQLNQLFTAQSGDIDVANVDVIWPGMIAMHCLDLSEQIAMVEEANGVKYFQRILDNNTVDGSIVSVPIFTDAGMLYYRTDLLEKYGYDAAPGTWAELEEQAQAIMDGETGEGKTGFSGFTFQAAAYEGLTCNGLEWMYSQGGGEIVTPDGEVTVGRDEAKAAIERAKSWVGGIAPSAVTGYMEEDGRGVWQGGNCAFHRNWPYVYAISAADDSDLQGMFDLTTLPAGDHDGAEPAATLGGWNTMASAYSANPDAAKLFAAYMGSYECQVARAIERSQNPTISEVYDVPEVIEVNPFMTALRDTFENGAVARPSNVAADLYNDVSIAYFTKVNEILTGNQEDVAVAMDDLQAELEDIMADV